MGNFPLNKNEREDYTLRNGSICIGAGLINPPTHGFTNPESVSGMPGTHHKLDAAISRPNREDLGTAYRCLVFAAVLTLEFCIGRGISIRN